jgi:alkylation response protein AidB-like acyl-CoA dehydrogenase
VFKWWKNRHLRKLLGITVRELALKYSQERKAFGKDKHQAIAFKLVDMATQITAAKMLVLKAATEKTKEHFSIRSNG